MKVFGRVLERKLRDQVNIDGMNFGFMPGKGTMDAIFVAKNRELCICGSGDGI